MALLRPGRCCSRRPGGCLQHRTEAQRQPKGQDAGGTPALPGDAVPAVQWRVPGAGKRLMTWLRFLNDCPEINKMLNVSFKSLSTSHYSLST